MIALMVRSIGRALIVSILKFVVTCVLSAAGAAAAVTVIASDTAATFISTSARLVVATSTVTRLRTLCNPDISKMAVYSPGGRDGKL